MRKIAQKGIRSKRAQTGVKELMWDFAIPKIRAARQKKERPERIAELERNRQQMEKDYQMKQKRQEQQKLGGKTVKRVKKAQEGTMKVNKGGGRPYEDFSETNVYKSKPGLRNKMKSALYEGQPWFKARKAEEERRAKLTEDERRLEQENVKRRVEIIRQEQEARDRARGRSGGNQRKGGITKKAQTGARTKAQKGTRTKAQMGVRTKAQYGTARKSSSRRSK